MVQEYALAGSPQEAAEMVAADPEAVVMGGGTTVMPKATLGQLNGRRVIGLARAGLDYVRGNGITTLGAMASLGALTKVEGAPVLASAARSIGSWPLRTTATVGGNVLSTRPYGDLVPALLALDAQIAVAGAGGERKTSLAEALQAGDVVAPGEILKEVLVPAQAGSVGFQRCSRIAAGALSIVTVAARVLRDGDRVAEARIAIGAVGERAVRAREAEEALVGSAGDASAVDEAVARAAGAVEPADDSVASAWYRGRMVELHVRRALEEALSPKPPQETS